MPSKNTKPFLTETWDTDGWSDGWTTAKAYTTAQGIFLMHLKSEGYGSDDNNVHINSVLSDGRLGPRVFSKRWTQGWTSAEFYVADSKSLLLIHKQNGFGTDGYNIHIDEVLNDGNIGRSKFVKRVDEGFNIAKVYSVGDRHFLFLLRSLDGKIEIYTIKPDGDIGNLTRAYNWTAGWTSLEFYKIGGTTFMLSLKTSDGLANIDQMTAQGAIGQRVKPYDWGNGWTLVRHFEMYSNHYLLFLKSGSGTVHITDLRSDGTVGDYVCQYARKPSYTSKFETGSMADWGPRPWTGGWTTAEYFKIGENAYLFFVKRALTQGQKKRAKIYRVNPMETVGPMVSYVSSDQASIWMGTVDANPMVEVTYRDTGLPRRQQFEFDGTDKSYYRAGHALLTGLKADTAYRYTVESDGNRVASGAFRTAPSPHQRCKLSVALVSCANLKNDREQTAWNHVTNQGTHLMLQIGDNAYPNTTVRSMIWAEHLQQRGVQSFANAISTIPSLATWDDHDFGPNNSAGADVEKDNREETQSAFRQLFPDLPFAASEGIYYKAVWGDIEFYMLDTRYFRNHYGKYFPLHGLPNGNHQRKILDDRQWNWLKQSLRASTAHFKVIVIGMTVNAKTIKKGVLKLATETWSNNYPSEWESLKQLVETIPGVILVSGDIHECQFISHAWPNLGSRILPEIISSGMTGQRTKSGFVVMNFDTTAVNNERIVCKYFQCDGALTATHTITLAQIS